MREPEQLLTGGNVSPGVVRIGNTVRKMATESTSSVEAFLNFLHTARFTAVPRSLGRDEGGRHILEYIPGVCGQAGPPMTAEELTRVGRLIRWLHDLSTGFRPEPSAKWEVAIAPDTEELICHNDLAPWNLIRDGERWVFIDWDGAGPSSRLWDLSYACVTFLPMHSQGDPEQDGLRLKAILNGYGLKEGDRRRLPELIVRRTRAMYELLWKASCTGQQPWARLHAEGHAVYWGSTADYANHNKQRFCNALL